MGIAAIETDEFNMHYELSLNMMSMPGLAGGQSLFFYHILTMFHPKLSGVLMIEALTTFQVTE